MSKEKITKTSLRIVVGLIVLGFALIDITVISLAITRHLIPLILNAHIYGFVESLTVTVIILFLCGALVVVTYHIAEYCVRTILSIDIPSKTEKEIMEEEK